MEIFFFCRVVGPNHSILWKYGYMWWTYNVYTDFTTWALTLSHSGSNSSSSAYKFWKAFIYVDMSCQGHNGNHQPFIELMACDMPFCFFRILILWTDFFDFCKTRYILTLHFCNFWKPMVPKVGFEAHWGASQALQGGPKAFHEK